MNPVLQIILVTFLPLLELRASIPYGILALNVNWVVVFLTAIVANIILGLVVYWILDKFIHLIIKIKPLGKFYHKTVERTQKKIHKTVEKYGELGVAIFIGIPLPMSGVYTGALGAYLLGLGYKKFMIANIIGVLFAAIIVTLVTLTGAEAFNFLIKTSLIG